MGLLTLKGLILKENDRGESSKSVTVLTSERGVINVFIRGGRKSTKNASATQMFAYSKLCLDERRNARNQTSYYLNSCESEKLFYNLRLDPKKTALACYLTELLMYVGTESSDNLDIMRLTLNTLHFLNNGQRDMELLKSIFEFRLLCEAGFRPDLLCCAGCMAYEADTMYLDIASGKILCENCCKDPDDMNTIPLDRTMLYIVRFIALTEYERLFAFKISKNYQKKLTHFTESCVGYHLKRKFTSLDFYKML